MLTSWVEPFNFFLKRIFGHLKHVIEKGSETVPTYTYDHIHRRSVEPMETAQYFNKMFDAKIIETVQSDGQPRVDIDVNGLIIFIAKAGKDTPPSLKDPHLGLDHFGFEVDDMESAAAHLRINKVHFICEPWTMPSGSTVAFVEAPDHVSLELIQRPKA